MKQCIACNAILENEASETCPACGAVQHAEGAVITVGREPSGYDVLVNGLRSKKYLILTVCYTVVVFFTLLNSSNASTLYSVFTNNVSVGSTPAFLLGVIIGAVLGILLPIVMCVGMWVLLTAAKKEPATGVLSLVGLRMYRIGFIVSNILNCLALVVLSIGSTFLLSMIKQQMELTQVQMKDEWVLAVLQMVGVVPLIIFVFVLIYLLKFAKTLKAVHQTAQTKVTAPFVSGYVIVIQYIFGVVYALLTFVMLIGGATGAKDVFLIGSMAVNTLYTFLLASGLSGYKKMLLGTQGK